MPKLPVQQFAPNADNAFILNAIRKFASSDYQRRIPEATKANVRDTVRNVLGQASTRNEFLDALVNQIGLVVVRGLNWTNPLAKFKRGMLEWGDSIEMIQTGLVDSYVYDPDREYLERALFGQHKPNVQAEIHKVDRQEYYAVTVNQAMLQRAFTSDTGLISLVNEIMNAPTVSDNHDEFNVMTSLFKTFDDADGFFRKRVPDVSNFATGTDAQARAMLKEIRSTINTLQFLSPHYNAAGMHSAAKLDELELFITPEASAALDVDALAGAFNISHADVQSRMTLVPQANFNIPGAQALLTTKDFFVAADTLYETRSQPNPVGLTDNYYLHHHQIISATRFVPAVLFTSEGVPSEIIELSTPVTAMGAIAVYDATAETPVTELVRGGQYQVIGSAVTTPEGGYNDAISLELIGAQSPRTYITNTGTLVPALDEEADELAIVATSVDDAEFSATVTLDVTGDRAQLFPNPSVIEEVDPPVGG